MVLHSPYKQRQSRVLLLYHLQKEEQGGAEQSRADEWCSVHFCHHGGLRLPLVAIRLATTTTVAVVIIATPLCAMCVFSVKECSESLTFVSMAWRSSFANHLWRRFLMFTVWRCV